MNEFNELLSLRRAYYCAASQYASVKSFIRLFCALFGNKNNKHHFSENLSLETSITVFPVGAQFIVIIIYISKVKNVYKPPEFLGMFT